MVVAREERFLVILESAVCDGFADAVGGVDDEVFVMNTGEDFSGDFVGLEKVVEVSARVIFTTFAVTVFH